ncbi:fimbria/pilus outer membrane usher protein [Roseateles violae]|uniref:Fimbria/pilus outer membrane usher protein n=1 Tax=Roseateles violae TaxID=3058042 RepID=A0ABT8DMT1_9BURK|nr:fimbria/pilus outer membrane usher protein [Pelomonas sp. PFR6]MDN3919700.1 fimbria/pilus outer membrane usher protein [Pelomonas sp. PFR6]
MAASLLLAHHACRAGELDGVDSELSDPAGTAAQGLVLLEATVNGQAVGSLVVLPQPGGRLLVERAALRRWRVKALPDSVIEIESRPLVALDAIAGATATIDQRTQRLHVRLPPSAFEPGSHALQRGGVVESTAPPWGGFANYKLFGFSSEASSFASGLFELGVSGRYGAGNTSFGANTATFSGGTTGRLIRLESAWRYDLPSKLRTVTLGDAITTPGAWGRSIRFGGLQIGSNFSLQPNLLTYPLPAVPGTAVVPSTVDVFVNGSRVGSQPVDPGPFSITGMPVVTGSGEVQLIVRDAFGQQQLITQPFYTSRRLLAPALDDYRISIGAPRRNYGLASSDYGDGFGSAYWRRGLSDKTTVELRAEVDAHVRAGGATVDWNPANLGVISAGLAASHGDAGSGQLAVAGYEYQRARFNIVLRGLWASPEFRLAGDETSLRRLARSTMAALGYNFGAAGSLGLAWAGQASHGEPAVQSATLSYSFNPVKWASLILSASRSWGASVPGSSFFASLVLPLGEATTASVDASSSRSGSHDTGHAALSLQKAIPSGEGWGYRLRAGSDQRYEIGGTRSGRYGIYSADIASGGGSSAVRFSAEGGIGYVDATFFAARPIVDSFALVRVGQFENVRVYHEGNYAGRTDAEGKLILPRLYPYQPNRISIDEKDLPIDITLAASEQRAAPYFRSAALVDFDARRRLNALLRVLLPDGTPLPAGAELQYDGSALSHPVADDGEVFIPDLPLQARFVARWGERRCSFQLRLEQAPAERLPVLGPFLCKSGAEP